MGLEPCPDCAHKVSPAATRCPSCGAPLRRPRGVDRGFHFLYWGLSYRRKFLRTLWIVGLSPTLLLFPERMLGHVQVVHFSFLVVLLTGAAQLIYNYTMWKDLEG